MATSTKIPVIALEEHYCDAELVSHLTGAEGTRSKDLLERLCLDLLGLKYKYVTGYTSNALDQLVKTKASNTAIDSGSTSGRVPTVPDS